MPAAPPTVPLAWPPEPPVVAPAAPAQAIGTWPGGPPAEPRRGWVLVVLWLIVVALFIVESLWTSLLTEPDTWRAEGIEPSSVAIAALIGMDLVARIGIGFLVGTDLKRLGAGRLKLSRVPATSFERTTPLAWGILSAIVVVPCAGILSMMRRRIRLLAAEAQTAPAFADKKELQRALKAKGAEPSAFTPAQLKELRSRQGRQTAVFFGLFLVMWFLTRF